MRTCLAVQAPMCTGCCPCWQRVCGLSNCAHSVPGSGTAHCRQHLARDHLCGVWALESRAQDLWLVIAEAYRLGNAAARRGGLALSMFTDPSRPHQVFPLLKAKAKETEWFCRALTFVWPLFNVRPTNATRTCPGRWPSELYLIAGRAGFSIQEKTLTIALSMLAHCNWLSKWAETTSTSC